MEIVNVKIKDLIDAEYNPRILNQEQYKALKDSLQRFGCVDPIIVNSNPDRKNIIIGGHMRCRVWQDLGNEEIPVFYINLPLEKEKELNIRLNKNTGEWDFDKLANEFDQDKLLEWGFDKDEFGFVLNENEVEETIGDDDVPEVQEKTKTVKGDLYELGNHRLLCGDSTVIADVEKLMNGEKADMVFTDHPYGVSYVGINNPNGKKWDMIKNDFLRDDELFIFLEKAFKNLFLFTKDNPAIYIWHASSNQIIFETALNSSGFKVKQQLIWNKGMILGHSDYHWSHEPCFYCRKKDKNNEWFGDRKHKTILRQENIDFNKFKKNELIQILNAIKDDATIWEIKRDNVGTYIHPTQKPVDLNVKAMINNTLENNIILDLFLGSGSTIIGAEKLKRKCYGMELDEHYCDVIIKRYIDFCKKNNKPYSVKRNGKDCLNDYI